MHSISYTLIPILGRDPDCIVWDIRSLRAALLRDHTDSQSGAELLAVLRRGCAQTRAPLTSLVPTWARPSRRSWLLWRWLL